MHIYTYFYNYTYKDTYAPEFHPHQKTFCKKNCHKIQTYPGYIKINTKILGWENLPNDTWHTNINSGIIKVRSPWRTTTFLKRKHTMFTDTSCPENKCALRKGNLFDLPPIGIIHTIYIWIIVLKNHENFNAVVEKSTDPAILSCTYMTTRLRKYTCIWELVFISLQPILSG